MQAIADHAYHVLVIAFVAATVIGVKGQKELV